MKIKLNLSDIIKRREKNDSLNEETLTRRSESYFDRLRKIDTHTPIKPKATQIQKRKVSYCLPKVAENDFKEFYRSYSHGKLIKVVRRRPFSPITCEKINELKFKNEPSWVINPLTPANLSGKNRKYSEGKLNKTVNYLNPRIALQDSRNLAIAKRIIKSLVNHEAEKSLKDMGNFSEIDSYIINKISKIQKDTQSNKVLETDEEIEKNKELKELWDAEKAKLKNKSFNKIQKVLKRSGLPPLAGSVKDLRLLPDLEEKFKKKQILQNQPTTVSHQHMPRIIVNKKCLSLSRKPYKGLCC
ncbi:unnamed protein product [Blepharisma stoltei]|uniref:Uncharacterized protein n=1 Tax=Blepharisma stoltei TaxID=1481888 RepID=A0AAU9K6W8_9CILI|nr:unnamed protein product [Blepharisma stoltei]